MATIVLSAVGGLVGGPLGAVIGAQVGNYIDHEILFKPKGREGPRLSELRVQTSSYGTQIPKLFGTMRVAGSVIWANDLSEHRSTSSRKGQPTTTSYSYTASFAVALSARAIQSVGRIWADGKLLRGAGGDFKTRTGFRLHLGDEDQAADPLIAAAEGGGQAPAHRGIAYAVFENLELSDFGNRIPSLTFEVTADAGAREAGEIAAELAGGEILCGEATPVLAGFSAYGASVRAVAETLAGAAGGWFRAGDAGLELLSGTGNSEMVADSGTASRGRAGGRGTRTMAAADSAPRSISLTHYDPARDYQIGVQRAARPGAGRTEARTELAAAIDAGSAKTIAEAALARFELERERRSMSLGWDRLALRPGARVTIGGAAGLWRIERWSLEAMVVTLDCVRIAAAPLPAGASGGRVLPAPDMVPGETLLQAFELPPLDDTLASAPRLAIAAAGTAPGWRSAALLLSSDGGAHWAGAGSTALPAVLGTVVAAPGAGPSVIRDDMHAIEIALAHEAMLLGDADDAALDAGANLAMIGDELLQFARAEPLGGVRWRLSGLWRGRRGTEAAAGAQAAGDRFVLIAADSLHVADLPSAAIGARVDVLGQGAGDADGAAEAEAAINGISVVPPSPVHLAAEQATGGGTMVTWVRRSRAGWRWIDGVDSPLAEESERYRVTIAGGGLERIEETAVPLLLLTAADRSSELAIEIRQIGSHGVSAPAHILLPALEES